MSNVSLTGRIFDIQRMSLHDGPGIRTNVFFKGCNLRCFWCHNPESLKWSKQIQFFAERCIGCGMCVSVCPYGCHVISATDAHIFLRQNCHNCGLCADACPSGSLTYTGRDWPIADLVAEVMRDKPFFDHSGGGITLSGGEPFLQQEFVAAFLKQLKEKHIHTAVESAFNVPFSSIEAVLPYTDLFLVDFKHPDGAEHKKVTGCSNELILQNIRRLDQSSANYCLRIPIIPEVNDTVSTMEAVDAFAKDLNNLTHVELMPYHNYGIGKYISLDLDVSKQNGMEAPGVEKLTQLANAFTNVPVEFRVGPRTITISNVDRPS